MSFYKSIFVYKPSNIKAKGGAKVRVKVRVQKIAKIEVRVLLLSVKASRISLVSFFLLLEEGL